MVGRVRWNGITFEFGLLLMRYGSSKLFYNRCGLGVDLWVND